MRFVTAEEVEETLDFPSLVDGLHGTFRIGAAVPVRHHHSLPRKDEPDATLLLMPAWQGETHIGVKIVTVTPGNGRRGLPAVMGVYLLLDGSSGAPLAIVDGPMLTLRRTAAVSALASRFLSRPDSETLLMVGAGALAPHLIEAHAAVRPIRRVLVWNHRPERARELADNLADSPFEVSAIEDLEAAVGQADIVSCATLTQKPLIQGAWLRPGQHLDLVGGFTPDMREADDEAVRRSQVFVDTRDGATMEAGDIVEPIARGVLATDAIIADLIELSRGDEPPPRAATAITFFKSVGSALSDLGAAQLVVGRL